MRRPNYWKEYREKNREKFRDYERLRNALRRHRKLHSLKGAPIQAKLVSQRCMAKDCLRRDALPVIVVGMKAYLCVDHKSLNIFA